MFSFDPSEVKRDALELVGIGLSSDVIHIKGTNFVLKKPSPIGHDDVKIEKTVYERLGLHPNILVYHGQVSWEHLRMPYALVFEYHPSGNLLGTQFAQHPRRQLWPLQAASAVSYVHSKGVVHGDIGLHNFLLKDNGDIVLNDFAGSGIDGISPTVAPGGRYENPLLAPVSDPSELDDVFALGTVLYEFALGKRGFQDRTDSEIRQCFLQQQFPDLSQIDLPLRKVVLACWQQEGYTAADAARELQEPTPTSVLDCGVAV